MSEKTVASIMRDAGLQATEEGWVSTAAVMDVFSRTVVGWSAADHLSSALVEKALQEPISQRRSEAGLLHHSDRNVRYTIRSFRRLLDEHGIVCRMGRKKDCYDNTLTESCEGRPDRAGDRHGLVARCLRGLPL